MTSFNEAFDDTIRDPIDPEHSIEDPMHGPSALASLAEIPPMPVGNGLFYKPGMYYETGHTAYVDVDGNPVVVRFEGGQSIHQGFREAILLSEWVHAFRDGTLDELEARREAEAQQKAEELRARGRQLLSTMPIFKLDITAYSPTIVPMPGNLQFLNDVVKVNEGLGIDMPVTPNEDQSNEDDSSTES